MKSKKLVILLGTSALIFVPLFGTSSLFAQSRPKRNIFESAMFESTKDFSKKLESSGNVNQKDKDGCPLLLCTMRYVDKGKHYDKMVLLLNKGADIEARNKSGWTPLFAAVKIEAENMVRELLKRGAKTEVLDKENQSPLSVAIIKDLLPIVKLLLKEGKANPNHVVMKTLLPIQLAARMRNPKAFKLLLTYGATYDLSKDALLNLDKNCYSESFLQRVGRLTCVEILLKRSKTQALGEEWLESMALNNLLLKYKMTIDWKKLAKKFPYLCSHYGKLEVVDFILSQKKLPQYTLDLALTNAVNAYRPNVVKHLLSAGANADSHLVRGRSALENAWIARDSEIIEALTHSLKNIPAKPVNKKRYIDQRELDKIKKYSSAKATTVLKRAIASASNQEIVKILIDCGADLNLKYSNGDTLLHRCKSPEITELLLKSGAKANVQNRRGKTPLFNSSSATTVVLCEYGADPNLADKSKQTPLFNSYTPKTRILLRAGAKANMVDKRGRTPLFYADSMKAELLIAAGADVNVKDRSGDTPLTRTFSRTLKRSVRADIFDVLLTAKPKIDKATMSRFVSCQPVEILQRLQAFAVKKVKSNPAEKGVTNKKAKLHRGKSPLVSAADFGRTSALKILLEAGNYSKPELNLALQRAVRDANNLDCVEMLVLAGADVNVLDWNRNSAFSMSAGSGAGDVKDRSKIFFRLLKEGGNVNWKNSAGYTLLHCCHSPKVAKYLLTKLDVDARDKELQTPLHRFARHDSSVPIITVLLKAGADPNLQDTGGRTPLYIAMSVDPMHGKVPNKIIKLLKDAGAKEIPDKRGVKPSDQARFRKEMLKRRQELYKKYLKQKRRK